MKPVPANLRNSKNKKYQESFRGLFLLGEHRGVGLWDFPYRHCFVAGNPVTLLGALSDAGNPISGLVVMLYN